MQEAGPQQANITVQQVGQFRSLRLCRLIPLETQPGWSMPAKTAPSGTESRIPCQPHVAKRQLGNVQVDTLGGGGVSGKAGPCGRSHHSWPPGVSSEQGASHPELQGTPAKPCPGDRMLWLWGQAVLWPHAQTLRVFQLFDCQLTMQPLGWFEFNILHTLREKFKDCSLQQRLVSFLFFPPGKWKHKAGSSSPCLSSPYKLQ